MRLLLIASLLVLACSSKASQPDGPTDTIVNADHGGLCPSGYPCCIFADNAAAGSAQCNALECVLVDAGGDPPPDAGPFGCRACPDGYACAAVCPSPNGGCGGPPTCCRPR